MPSLPMAALVQQVTDACRWLLDDLEPGALARASFSFDAPERRAWHYIPMERPGLPIGELSERQHALFDVLLGTVLTPEGVATVRSIMAHEVVLAELEQQEGTSLFVRDPDLYTLAIFGRVGARPWAWRLEGHHLSLNVTVAGPESIAVLPSFFGANPAEVRFGEKDGLRILAPLEDLARELVHGLDPARLSRARIADEAPWDIVTVNAPVLELGAPEGIPAVELSGPEQAALRSVLEAYAARWVEPVASALATRIDEQTDALHLAWAGGLEPGEPHYYRIQGPTVFLEYVNAQNEANHIHTIWRDAELDFAGL